MLHSEREHAPLPDLLLAMSTLHCNAALLSASWDRDSERCFPAGILCLDQAKKRAPLGLPVPVVDGADAANSAATSQSEELPPVLLLRQSVPALPVGIGMGVGEDQHVQPLIAAPNYLLLSPQHPCYPMTPTAWYPFAPTEQVKHFLTPFHRGLFNTRVEYLQMGTTAAQPKRSCLFRMQTATAAGAFSGVVHFGSVVSFTEGESTVESQGVVVLTYVRFSESAYQRYEQQVGAFPEGSSIDRLMDRKIPVPMLAVLKLQRPAAAADEQRPFPQRSHCWQAIDEPATVIHVRTSDVLHIWSDEQQLGQFGYRPFHESLADCGERPMLRHRPGLRRTRRWWCCALPGCRRLCAWRSSTPMSSTCWLPSSARRSRWMSAMRKCFSAICATPPAWLMISTRCCAPERA